MIAREIISQTLVEIQATLKIVNLGTNVESPTLQVTCMYMYVYFSLNSQVHTGYKPKYMEANVIMGLIKERDVGRRRKVAESNREESSGAQLTIAQRREYLRSRVPVERYNLPINEPKNVIIMWRDINKFISDGEPIKFLVRFVPFCCTR